MSEKVFCKDCFYKPSNDDLKVLCYPIQHKYTEIPMPVEVYKANKDGECKYYRDKPKPWYKFWLTKR